MRRVVDEEDIQSIRIINGKAWIEEEEGEAKKWFRINLFFKGRRSACRETFRRIR